MAVAGDEAQRMMSTVTMIFGVAPAIAPIIAIHRPRPGRLAISIAFPRGRRNGIARAHPDADRTADRTGNPRNKR